MPSSKVKKPVVMYLMSFKSLKRGSFERFLLSMAEEAGQYFDFVFVFMAQPPEWLHSALLERGASVDWAYLVTSRHGFQEIDRLVSRYRPDIAHFHFFSLLTPFIPYVRWRHWLKVVVHVHGVIPYNKGKTRLRTSLIPLRKYAFCRSADSVICVSNFVRAKTLSEFGNTDSKTMTIYNGLDLSSFDGNKSTDLRSVIGLPSSAVVLFTAAWLSKIKGVDVAIKGLPLLFEKIQKDVHLVIAGDGEESSSLKNLSHSLGVGDRVHFLGWRNDVPDLIAEADIVIMPSVGEEAFSYFVLESMAMGKPVVGSEIGGIPELLGGHPRAGVMFPAGNAAELTKAIVGLVQNESLGKSISRECRKRTVERFQISSQIKRVTGLYAKLLY